MQWFRNIPRASISFLWVVALFVAYSLCVVPLVEPWSPEEDEVADSETTRGNYVSATDRYVRELAPLFPEGSWELDDPKVLRSDQGTVLLKEFEQLADGSLHVKPCTIVFYGSSSSGARGPTVLQAPEGAILAFDEPLDIERGSFFKGKPTHGSLVGDIRIFSAGGPDSDDLIMGTSNVQISEKQIWTPEKVTFRFGNNYGSGRDLLIKRVEEPTAMVAMSRPKKAKKGWMDELGIIQLQHLDELTMRVGGNIFSSIGGQSSQQGRLKEPTSTARVLCDGPLNIDMQRAVATAESNVRIMHLEDARPQTATNGRPTATANTATAKPDTLYAQQLTMHLTRAAKQPIQTVSTRHAGKDAASASGKLALARVTALGDSKNGRPLVIDAPSRHAYVQGQSLEYDFETKKVLLQGYRPKGTAGSPVWLRNTDHNIVAGTIEFVGGEDPESWRLLASGPGSYSGSPAQDKKQKVGASWQRQMLVEPAEGQQVLRMDGNATVQAPGMGTITSDTIELWLRYESYVVGTNLDGSQVVKREPIPTQLITRPAQGRNVVIDAPQFVGELRGLKVLFANSTINSPSTTSSSTLSNGRTGIRQSQNNPFGSPNQSTETDEPITSRYRVNGGELTAIVDPVSQKPSRVVVKGQSTIIEEQITPLGPSPQPGATQLVGSTIDYQLDPAGQHIVVLRGNPAVLKTSQFDFSGTDVQFLGRENRINIPGAGTLKLRVSADVLAAIGRNKSEPNGATRPVSISPADLTANPTSKPAELIDIDVSWQRRLDFDGQVIQLQGTVVAEGPDFSIRTDDLEITLDQTLDLTELATNTDSRKSMPKLGVVDITAKGRVFAAIRGRDDQEKPSSLQQIVTQNLNIDYMTGDVVADGPGWLSMTTMGNRLQGLTNSRSSGSQESNSTGTSSDEAETLSQLSVAFAHQLTGNVHRREASFDNDIRAWFGPVDSWKAHVDPLKVETLSKEDFRMNCRELLIFESPNAVASEEEHPMELIARGETVVEGQLFWARGHQIKFAEDKGMLTMEGDERRPAQLWQRKFVGGPASNHGQFGEIRYWPKTRRLKVDRALGADISSAASAPSGGSPTESATVRDPVRLR